MTIHKRIKNLIEELNNKKILDAQLFHDVQIGNKKFSFYYSKNFISLTSRREKCYEETNQSIHLHYDFNFSKVQNYRMIISVLNKYLLDKIEKNPDDEIYKSLHKEFNKKRRKIK
jgi:hypothetical protein